MLLSTVQGINLYEALEVLRDRAVFYAGCNDAAILRAQGNHVDEIIKISKKFNCVDFQWLNQHTAQIEISCKHSIAKACARAMQAAAYSVLVPECVPDQLLSPWQCESLADKFYRQANPELPLESFPASECTIHTPLKKNYRDIIDYIRTEAFKSAGILDITMGHSFPESAKNYVDAADQPSNRKFSAFYMEQVFGVIMSSPQSTASIKLCARAIRNVALSAVNNAGGIQEWRMTGDEIAESANTYLDRVVNSVPLISGPPQPPKHS